MRLSIGALAITGFALSGGTCLADTEVLSKAGAWQAFGGTTTNGRAVCGMSSSGNGRYFGVKFFAGDETLTIQLGDSNWTLKNKIKVKVEMRFDDESPWHATATGMHFNDGDAGLEFDINKGELEQFMREFSNSNEMAISFPDQDVSSWTGSLAGTDKIFKSFAKCLREL